MSADSLHYEDHESRTSELIDAILADARRISRMGQRPSMKSLIEKHNGGKIPGPKRLAKIRIAMIEAGFLKKRIPPSAAVNDKNGSLLEEETSFAQDDCNGLSEEQCFVLMSNKNDIDYELSRYADKGNKRALALLLRRLTEY